MEKEYLIRQAPAKALLAFSTPMIIGNLFQQLYTMTDSVIVGQAVGESALAAVGASYALTNVFISIAIDPINKERMIDKNKIAIFLGFLSAKFIVHHSFLTY